MDNFAFIIHPVDPKRDVQRKFPLLGKILSERAIDFLSQYFPPVYISHVTGITSQETGKEIEGWFIACPLTPRQMLALPPETVYKKVIQAGKLAQKLGAKILGLGGFTSVVGDGGLTIAQHLDIPVTTGDSYTVAVAVDATHRAALLMNINLMEETAAVVGATGSIGRVCAQLLAPQVGNILLVGRRLDALHEVKALVEAQGQAVVSVSTNMADLQKCKVVLTVTNATDAVIEPYHLQSGAVVCDVARPRDVSRQVTQQRDDILVIEGGTVKIPGNVDFNFNFGLPSGMAFACMAETMTLALEGRYENYTIGKKISLEQVDQMYNMADRHGCKVSGFRSFELTMTEKEIARIMQNVHQKQAKLHWANS